MKRIIFVILLFVLFVQQPVNATCAAGQYDSDTTAGETCSACPVKCSTCDVNTTCTACPSAASSHRVEWVTSTATDCACAAGYYEAIPASKYCSRCPAKCSTCDVGTNCTACANSSNRNAASDCACQAGFYQVGTLPVCSTCKVKCSTCDVLTTCTACTTTANSNRITWASSAPDCACAAGFYEAIPAVAACSVCPVECSTCSSATRCTACTTIANSHRDGNCACVIGHYEATPPEAVCGTCPVKCYTCSSATVCTDCAKYQNRITWASSAPDCECAAGFEESVPAVALCDPVDGESAKAGEKRLCVYLFLIYAYTLIF